MKKIYIVMFVIFMHINVYAQWIAVNTTDDFTDKKIAYLAYENDNAVVLIDKKNGMKWITIQQKGINGIDPATSIELRIDKNELYESNIGLLYKTYKENAKYQKKDMNTLEQGLFIDQKTIAFKLLSVYYIDTEKEKFLCDLARGNFLLLRYSLKNGYKESLKIPLDGIAKKIETVFGNNILSRCKQ